MGTLETAALAGGLFALFTFVHFVVDWLFQSHSEAMVKHNNSKVRAKHCYLYTLPFIPLFLALGMGFVGTAFCAVVLFVSHFYEDTYVPVYLWAKHIRVPPDMGPGLPDEMNKEAFVKFIETPLGKILMIAVDQIIHLTFLWVPVLVLLW